MKEERQKGRARRQEERERERDYQMKPNFTNPSQKIGLSKTTRTLKQRTEGFRKIGQRQHNHYNADTFKDSLQTHPFSL